MGIKRLRFAQVVKLEFKSFFNALFRSLANGKRQSPVTGATAHDSFFLPSDFRIDHCQALPFGLDLPGLLLLANANPPSRGRRLMIHFA